MKQRYALQVYSGGRWITVTYSTFLVPPNHAKADAIPAIAIPVDKSGRRIPRR